MISANEARKLRIPKEEEAVGKKNTFNLLVGDILNDIECKIHKVASYTDGIEYKFKYTFNRNDVVDAVMKELQKAGYNLWLDMKFNFNTRIYLYTLYISWNLENDEEKGAQ